MTVAALMYKKLGVSNEKITFWTGLLYLPWVIKPLWGPLVDLYWTKRKWIIWLQLLMGLIFGFIAFALNLPGWWVLTLTAFAFTAFVSATHDIAADGFYMLPLDSHQQALFVGVRSTFYRMAMIVGQGVLIILVGIIEANSGPAPAYVTVRSAAKGVEQAAEPTQIPTESDFVKIDVAAPVLEAGTTTAVHLSLSKQPEKDVVVTFSRKPAKWYAYFFPIGAEQMISAVGGDRIVFPKDEWQKPQQVVLKADGKIATHKKPVSAVFQATAGDIVMSWTACFASMCGLFVLLFVWHGFALPKPATDGASAAVMETRPSFFRAAGMQFLTVLVPIGVFVGLFYSIKLAAVPMLLSEYGVPDALGVRRLPGHIDTLLTFGTILSIVVIVWGAFILQPVREVSLAAFRGASNMSGIPFADVFISFFQKKGIGIMLVFLLTYRLGEAMLVAMAKLFLIDERANGGLGLSVAQFGVAYGTVGVFGLLIGGILGGVAVATGGLKKWLFPMCLAINIPHVLYVYLAYARPDNFPLVVACVAVEQLCYGFGFAAYMLYMLFIAGEGEHKTSHFAITTGFMALSMMLPGMFSGALQKMVGYPMFFNIVVATMIIGLILIYVIPLDPEFGKKKKAKPAA